MKLKVIKIIIIVFLCLGAGMMFSVDVQAASLVRGHTYVKYQNATVDLKGVEVTWKITDFSANQGSCPDITNWYREVLTGDKISHTFDNGGQYPPAVTPTPGKKVVPADIDCTVGVKSHPDKNDAWSCTVDSSGNTIDSANRLQYVFQRTDCFGCRSQKGTLKAEFPDGFSALPGGLDPKAGHWEFRDVNDLCSRQQGIRECNWDQNTATLTFRDMNDTDTFTDMDFEWIPDLPSPTPTPTNTPTPPPVCGGPCTPNTTTCPLECPICAPDASGANKCVAPTPSSTPTPTVTATPPPVCGGPCTPGTTTCPRECPICAPGSSGSNICLAPTPTPTPSCDCDGLDLQGTFYSGNSVNITGFGKVVNPDINPAVILNMVYTLYKDEAQLTQSGEIAAAGVQRTTDSSGQTIDRYSSSWKVDITSAGSYKVIEKLNCAWKTTPTPTPNAQTLANSSRVMGTQDEKKGILASFADLFQGLFGGSNAMKQSSVAPTLTPFITATPIPQKAPSLKLQTLAPSVTVECTQAQFTVPL